MKYQIIVLPVFVAIVIGAFCIGQGNPTVKSRVSSDIKISDHDRIEKLQVEVTEIQKKLAALTQKYGTHTHPVGRLDFAQLPGSIECDQTVAQWTATESNRRFVDKMCRQVMPGNIKVLVAGKETMVTEPPRQ